MAKLRLIQLHQRDNEYPSLDNKEIWINPDHIVRVLSSSGGTKITLSTEHLQEVYVRESLEEETGAANFNEEA